MFIGTHGRKIHMQLAHQTHGFKSRVTKRVLSVKRKLVCLRSIKLKIKSYELRNGNKLKPGSAMAEG